MLCSGKMPVGVNFSRFGGTHSLLQDNAVCGVDDTSQNSVLTAEYRTNGVVEAAQYIQRKAQGEKPMAMEHIYHNVTKWACAGEDNLMGTYTYVTTAIEGI